MNRIKKGDQVIVIAGADKGKKGTVFGGTAEVGVTIEELLRREGKL